MTEFEKNQDMARRIARLVHHRGGRTFYVGGFVRDSLRGENSKDVDVELHGIAPNAVREILDSLGERISMGESFGVWGLKGYSLDIAMPRKETLRGVGHRDFDISVDPFIGMEKAAVRRDFTINALMQDVLTGEIIDHFGGQDDLRRGLIRHVDDETFVEDPLRVLRAAQFAARFGFQVADETITLCQHMTLGALSRERVEGELQKALLKASTPSLFFTVLRQMNRLGEWFPELEALVGVEQNPRYHLEGDVWTHTMMVVDSAAKFREQAANPLGFMLAAVAHDVGKAVCTERINGEIHAYGHEEKGIPLAERLLVRITHEKKLVKYALNLIRLHMKPNAFAAADASVKSTNRMFDEAVDPNALVYLALADDQGRISQQPVGVHGRFLRERLTAFQETMARPFVTGKDLIEAGLAPGTDFSEFLTYAHKLRLAGIEKESALKQTLAYARQLRKKKR